MLSGFHLLKYMECGSNFINCNHLSNNFMTDIEIHGTKYK